MIYSLEELSQPQLELVVPNLERLIDDLKEDVQNKEEYAPSTPLCIACCVDGCFVLVWFASFWVKRDLACKDVRGSSCQVLRAAQIECTLPIPNLHGVPIWIRLVDKRYAASSLACLLWCLN